MTAHAEHEARLRAALHAAVDSLEPRADGLERIRTRLRQPGPAYLAWAQTAYAEIVMRTPAWLQDAFYAVADSLRLAYERFAPAQAPGRHRSRAQGLLRPLAAMAVVMFIVAAGTYVAIDASTAIFPSSSSSQPGGAPNNGGHSGAPASPHASGTQSAAGTGSRPAASPTCKSASPKPGTTSAPTTPPPSPSASPSPSDSSTSTDTSSPSPSDTSSTTTPPASPPASAAPPPPTTTSPSAGPVLAKSPPTC